MSDKKKKIRITLIILAIGASILIALGFMMPTINSIGSLLEAIETVGTEPSADVIVRDAKVDDRGYRIDALKNYEEGESWAIYIYMVGSNLESGNVNSLSDLTTLIIADEVEANADEKVENRREMISNFVNELQENGMALPELFYLPTTPTLSSAQTSEDTSYEYQGSAMHNLNQIREVDLPENVQIVIQTGGAKAWSDISINPNRSERFLYDKDGFRKIESNPLVNMASPETLSDFLRYCDENYDADHKMIIFWNHGGGYNGFGLDEIYNNLLSLKDMKKAFSDVYGDQPEDPPFDIIGFDACLMAALEVVNTLYPYSDYLLSSEEVEPGDGWNYTPFLEAFENGSNIHAEKLAKAVIDGFAEYYARLNIQASIYSYNFETTLSLVDMKKGKEVQDAYSDFAKAVLKNAATDLSTLSDISRAGMASMIFSQGDFDYQNILDLKSFMENAHEYYPEETKAVLDALDAAVLYARGTSYGANAGGLTVSYPLYVTSLGSLNNMINYITNIVDDNAIKALYYYKIAGCLNDEHKEYVKTLGIENPQILDLSALNNLGSTEAEINESSITIPLTPQQYDLLQHASMMLAKLDGEEITYLGAKGSINMSENAIESEIDGKWITLNGEALAIDRISDTGESVKYRSKVIHNGNEGFLILSHNKTDNSVTILGVIDSMQGESEYLVSERTKPLERGDEITPIYYISDLNNTGIEDDIEEGRTVTIRGNERVSYAPLKDGSYILSISAVDFRGDEYFTPSLTFNMRGGNVENLKVDESYRVVLVD